MGVSNSPEIHQPVITRGRRSLALLAGIVLTVLFATLAPLSTAASAQEDEEEAPEEENGDETSEEEPAEAEEQEAEEEEAEEFEAEGGAVAEGEGEEGQLDQALNGRLQFRDEDGVRQPVSGASLTVEGVGINFLETVVTDEDGFYRMGLPEPGRYVVALDVGSLPEGVDLDDPDEETSDFLDVLSGEERGIIFRLTAGFDTASDTTFDRALRLGLEGLRFGLILAMASVGLSLIFGTTGLVNFAHGEMVTFGAILAYLFNQTGGIYMLYAALLIVAAGLATGVNRTVRHPEGHRGVGILGWAVAALGLGLLVRYAFFEDSDGLWLPYAVVVAAIVAGLAGAGFNRTVWRPLRDRGVGVLGMVIASIGLGLFIRYVFLYRFRGPRRSYLDYAFQTERYDFGAVTVLPRDLWIMGVSLVLLVGVGLALQLTRSGRAIRAVADDRDLAESSGVDVEQVITVVWISGAALAAVGGVFHALSQQVSWQMGEQLLLLMFAAVILGGLGTAYGALVGGVVIGLFFQLSALWIAPELRLSVAFMVLILVLLARPQGILGQAERVG